MVKHLLKRFEAFEALAAAELSGVARHTQIISIPANRWVLREGRTLSGSYYLVQGRVRLFSPATVVGHRSRDARSPLYPGHAAIRTLTAVRLLHVDTASVALLLGRADLQPKQEVLLPWEQRFLGSPLMRRLDAGVWQKLFSELDERPFAAGDDLIAEGDPASEFMVLKSGRAVVRRAGRTLAQLVPGDFFGEDALITNGRRNATVSALEAGAVLRLPKDRFVALLLDRVVRFAECSDAGINLDIGEPGALAQLRQTLTALDPKQRYQVIGGHPEERALATFILAQKGLDAWAMAED